MNYLSQESGISVQSQILFFYHEFSAFIQKVCVCVWKNTCGHAYNINMKVAERGYLATL